MPFANVRRLRRSESASGCGPSLRDASKVCRNTPPNSGDKSRSAVDIREPSRIVGKKGTREMHWCGEDSPD